MNQREWIHFAFKLCIIHFFSLTSQWSIYHLFQNPEKCPSACIIKTIGRVEDKILHTLGTTHVYYLCLYEHTILKGPLCFMTFHAHSLSIKSFVWNALTSFKSCLSFRSHSHLYPYHTCSGNCLKWKFCYCVVLLILSMYLYHIMHIMFTHWLFNGWDPVENRH